MSADGGSLLVARFSLGDGPVDERALHDAVPAVHLYRAADGGPAACLYAPADAADALRPLLPAAAAPPSLLACTLDVAGAASGTEAPWHYVVETDVLPAFEDEFNAWYDEEHLPGLAAVPGVVRARRLRRGTGSPRYHACYDLAAREAFGSAPWLAVRATPWSSRIRPAFRHTVRTLFVRAG